MRCIFHMVVLLVGFQALSQKAPDYSRSRLLLQWNSDIGISTFTGYGLGSALSFHKKRHVFALKFGYNYQSDQIDWRDLEPDTYDHYSNDQLLFLGFNYGRDFQFRRLVLQPMIGCGYYKYSDEHLGVVHVTECTGWIFTSCNEYDQIDQTYSYEEGVAANLDLGATYYLNQVLAINITTSLVSCKDVTFLNLSGGFVFCLNPRTESRRK